MLGSLEGRSRTSASVRPFDLTVCFCHDALRGTMSRSEREGEQTYSRVRLRDYVAAFGRDHDSLAYPRTTWIVDSF